MKLEFNNTPLIMGVINLTPDSYYTNLNNYDVHNIEMDDFNYADIIDIGCESSRPGSEPLNQIDELNRLTKFLDYNHKFDKSLSIDTYKPEVARLALENGFDIINDISAGGDSHEMFKIASEFDCPIILMHMRGCPQTMHNKIKYNNILDDIKKYFEYKISIAEEFGIKSHNIILDPGIGFGKTSSDNLLIINNLSCFKETGFPVLLGISRKSFLSLNNDSPKDRLSATLGMSTIAIQNEVDILRVHDIKETNQLKRTINNFNNYKNSIEPYIANEI